MGSDEREAVRTTIVGGRPPGSGRSNSAVPRGIEVLVKKASVDPEFREVLLEQRSGAAKEIALALEPAEEAVLNTIPREQLLGVIGRTVVPVEQRRAFLGRVAVAMLAALGVGVVGCRQEPDAPSQSRGARPDQPVQTAPAQGPKGEMTSRNRPEANPTHRVEPPANTALQTDTLSRTNGIRPDRPPQPVTDSTAPLPTNLHESTVTYGIQPDRPVRTFTIY